MAKVPGYRVGGKTGTAYKLENGVYAKKYVASFVGIAPMSNPRLIVAVMIDEPSNGKHYGGDVAGPAFANIMGGALRVLGIPQDAPQTAGDKPAAAEDSAKEVMRMERVADALTQTGNGEKA